MNHYVNIHLKSGLSENDAREMTKQSIPVGTQIRIDTWATRRGYKDEMEEDRRFLNLTVKAFYRHFVELVDKNGLSVTFRYMDMLNYI